MPDLPAWFLERIRAITRKRPRIVADHILAHGYVTTADLETVYGYKHPPRAARDLREAGIPLETFRVKDAEGRTIAAYRFGEISPLPSVPLQGRSAFPKVFQQRLIDRFGERCRLCQGQFSRSHLQIDHRIPYDLAPDVEGQPRQLDDYQLLCRSCNRSKSWACEHCRNWLELKQPALCQTCYWANPDGHTHVALAPIRRLALVWQDADVVLYERLQAQAAEHHLSVADYIQTLLKTIE